MIKISFLVFFFSSLLLSSMKSFKEPFFNTNIITNSGISKKLYERDEDKLIVNFLNSNKIIYKDTKILSYRVHDYYHTEFAQYLIVAIFVNETDNYDYLCINIHTGEFSSIKYDHVLYSQNNNFFISYSEGVEFYNGGYMYIYEVVPYGLPVQKYFKNYKYPYEPRNFKWFNNEVILFNLYNDLNKELKIYKTIYNSKHHEWKLIKLHPSYNTK